MNSDAVQEGTSPRIDISPSVLAELIDVFLGMSWVLATRATKIMENPDLKLRIYFQPLPEQSKASMDLIRQSCRTTSVAVQILNLLIHSPGRVDDPGHKFLKTLGPELVRELVREDLTDSAPVAAALLGEIARFYQSKQTQGKKQFWELKPMYEARAGLYISGKERWVMDLAAMVCKKHDLLQGRDITLSGGIVRVYERG